MGKGKTMRTAPQPAPQTSPGAPGGLNLPMRHPGPRAEPRVLAVPTGLTPIDIAFDGTEDLETAIAAAFDAAGLTSGFIEIEGLVCTQLQYVIPAKFEFSDRMAWYSAPRPTRGDTTIRSAYVSVGRDKGAGFTHCHGIWDLSDGHCAVGHLLAPATRPKAGQRIRAYGFLSAVFERCHDPETNFDLFAAMPRHAPHSGPCDGPPDAIVATLRPDQDVATTCAALCRRHGIESARIIGLGSLNGARFEGAMTMQDSASEFLVSAGQATPDAADLSVVVVDSAANVFDGRLAPGQGRVSITSEIVLLRDA